MIYQLQILTNGGPRFVVLYGSNGTGKTIVLFQCLVMLVSALKLECKSLEVFVLVGANSIKYPICGNSTSKHGLNYCGVKDCEESELIYDLKTRYLANFDQLKDVQPTSFEKACKGTLSKLQMYLHDHFIYVAISMLEMISGYDDQWSIIHKFEMLLKSYQEKAKQTNKIFVIFIDEMSPSIFEHSLEDKLQHIQAESTLVYVLLAISPSGRNLTKAIEIKFSNDDKMFIRQLRSRHRNSLLLSSFLVHLTYNYNKIKQSDIGFQCLSPSKDLPLDPFKLPDGEVTLWYHQSGDISDVEILQFLESTYLPEDNQVLVSPCQQNLSQSVYDWCLEKNWDIVSHGNMTGSERDLVIAFADDNFGNLEVMSRARKRLIIVTRYLF